MKQEIEYAEMLEIPVSTVNIERKKGRAKRVRNAPRPTADKPVDLQESVIARVNDRLDGEPPEERISADAELFAESANSEGSVRFDGETDRIDTVRLYSDEERAAARRYASEYATDGFETPLSKGARLALGIEFAAACALCGAIFLTNVFMPSSAINTFFRTLATNPTSAKTDDRGYADFTLSNVVNDFADVEMTISPAGVLSFQNKGCVYSAADGRVLNVEQNADGGYTVKIAHSDSFSGVITGLQNVYYAVGDEVKANVPVGYSDGESKVQVTMYSDGELLHCFELNEENCLAWVRSE